ncbi:hypothetical protein BDA96_03G444900 [Sorghum bicolor]|uniref:Secreted protein n=1 Tax=Sorghum bicolor TaxID=4558 RepID=A0A921UT70_SORBI|nr:hypothetical protein BDA96_03G444900 [Sorghum bicolor]
MQPLHHGELLLLLLVVVVVLLLLARVEGEMAPLMQCRHAARALARSAGLTVETTAKPCHGQAGAGQKLLSPPFSNRVVAVKLYYLFAF